MDCITKDIDSVDKYILTGGSSKIEAIFSKLSQSKGRDRLLMDNDFFNSVSKGLSMYAYHNKLPSI